MIRPHNPSDLLRSDRSAGDRERHRKKVRAAIKENIADIISEESIIGKRGDTIYQVPIRGIKEYRFIYGDNAPGAGEGDGSERPGTVIGKSPGKREKSDQKPGAGDQPGVDYYETEITLDEITEILFEDMELPDLERKELRKLPSTMTRKRKGYQKVGIRVRLDKRRTAIERIKRLKGSKRGSAFEPEKEEDDRFPFHEDDMRYRHMVPKDFPESNAVVICIMDTSGSMDTTKKYLARAFYYLLYLFVRTKYQVVEVVFVAHHTLGREVTEEEFFHKGESGGTFISSGYVKALEIIAERYHPALWNIYTFHCSDGDNFEPDHPDALKRASDLCDISNLFGYLEIKPKESGWWGSSMIKIFEKGIEGVHPGLGNKDNFGIMRIKEKKDVFPALKGVLAKEKVEPEEEEV